MNDIGSSDFFRDPALLTDPFAYFDAARRKCPVWREPHHDVVLVTGYEEAVQGDNRTAAFSSVTPGARTVPGLPVPPRGGGATGTACSPAVTPSPPGRD